VHQSIGRLALSQLFFVKEGKMSLSREAIRVMIVDDYDMVRRGLVQILSAFDDIEVVAEASNGEFAAGICQQYCPDVVLMDIRMPRKNGIEATRLIRSACPDTQVIALTSFVEENEIQTMLEAGAIGYLMKNVTVNELVSAIHHAHERQAVLGSEAAQLLINMSHRIRRTVPGNNLTERELEVLALMAEGLSNCEISARLTISDSTVKNHVSNILSKLGVSNRSRAVALAIEYHLTDAVHAGKTSV
jgi:two-component system, NarL family, response regulator LiaR